MARRGGRGGCARPARTTAADVLGAELAPHRPTVPYADVVRDRKALRRLLAAVAEFGFAVITSAPVEEGTVADIAELFGHVRTTNYGRVFDVRVRIDATNLAYTAMPLSLHTDNPYRDPAPTIQLLQCLASSATGGETILADGFRAVHELAHSSPDALAALAELPVQYAYRDATAELATEVPIVSLARDGRPVALHVNNRSKGVPLGTAEAIGRWYDAYLELLSVLERSDSRVVFRLDPGDVVVFDNLRVLHGRSGFSGEGERWLQGCYADRDALLSTLAVLELEVHS